MGKFKEAFVLAAVALVVAMGVACSAAPLIGQGETSLGFTTVRIGVLFRSF